ncbi:hypothetical protein KSP39_PZI014477 [Platanthera zijinensis]|uniref:Prolyl endopeptidase n=1 Tax=Platanthera zijinensis TaxID=2320716 RepID=A0AAP0G2C9_9ASPA
MGAVNDTGVCRGLAVEHRGSVVAVEDGVLWMVKDVPRASSGSVVHGGFEPSDYLTERKWAVSIDGTRVPISILYKKNLVKFDGFNPLFMYGYGSYGISIVPGFEAWAFTLVDRGFIYAIAHIRGGEEMGIKWYEDGELLKKRNTFIDFIACAEYLIENKYGSKEKLCINGGVGNGGLLIGDVLNMCPDLFKAAVLDYPFVDVVTSLLDPTISSTTSEWEELGDPRKEEYYHYIKSYSPVDNVSICIDFGKLIRNSSRQSTLCSRSKHAEASCLCEEFHLCSISLCVGRP